MQRVSLLQGNNLVQDYDISKIIESIASPGVANGLEVQSGKVTPGFAFIEVTRDTNTFRILFESTEDVIIDTTGTKKVFIEITQANIDDGSGNASNGTGIGEIKTAADYPSENYITLASIDSGVITDERESIYIPQRILKNSSYSLSSNGTSNYSIKISHGEELLDGDKFIFKADVTNNGSSSLQVNSLAAKTIKKKHDQLLIDGDILENQIVEVIYNSTDDTFEMLSQASSTQIISVNNTKSTITLGETVSAGDYLRLGNSSILGTFNPSVAGNNTTYYQPNFIGYDDTYKKAGGKFTIAKQGTLVGDTITLKLSKYNNPTGTLSLKIYSSIGGSVIATATYSESSIPSGSYGAAFSSIPFSFPGLVLSAGTYYLVLETNRANNVSNFSLWQNNNSSSNGYTINSSDVFTTTYSKDMTLSFSYQLEDTAKFYKASALSLLKGKYRGYAESSGILDGVINMVTGPIDNSRTGLTPGIKMYLSDTAGAISSTVGTIPIEIGTTISSTSLEMNLRGVNLSDRISIVISTNYVATTDGFLIAYGSATVNNATNYINGVVDGVTITSGAVPPNVTYPGKANITMPVLRGQTYQFNGNITSSVGYFIPLSLK